VNPSGNSGMATAGSGDVLTGLIAGFLAQEKSAVEAALLGVFVHGSAGDRVRDHLGEWGMLASDICAAVPETILAIARKQRAPQRHTRASPPGENLTSTSGCSNLREAHRD